MSMNTKKIAIAAVVAILIPLASCGGSDSAQSSIPKVKNGALSNLLKNKPGFPKLTTTTTPPTTTTLPPCSQGGACAVGDKGPGGGVVFYVGSAPIDVLPGVSDGGENLEIVNIDAQYNRNPYPTWGCRRTEILASKDQTIGAGAKSTKAIADTCADTNIYAKIALNLTLNGKSDWFMPSVNELQQLCLVVYQQTGDSTTACDTTRAVRPGLESFKDRIWTSNEGNYEYGQTYDLRYGKTSGVRKDTSAAMFAVVRAFSN